MNTDDPKFTAHVLGEMDEITSAERAEIEELIAADVASASEADELRALAARLRSELHGEQTAPLTDDQRAAVLAANVVPVSFGGAAESGKERARPWRPSRGLGSLALAASVVLCATLAWKVEFHRPLPPTEKITVTLQSSPENPSAAEEVAAPRPEPDAPALNPGQSTAQPAPAATPAPVAAPFDMIPRKDPLPEMSASDAIALAEGAADAPLAAMLAAGSASTAASEHPMVEEIRVAPPVKAQTQKTKGLASAQTKAMAPQARATLEMAPDPAGLAGKRGGASAGVSAKAEPDYFYRDAEANDALNPKTGKSREKAKALLEEAEKFADAGRHNLAFEKYEDVLGIDPYNKEARIGEEKLNRAARVLGVAPQTDPESAESYDFLPDNAFLTVAQAPLSTFSIDVDTASYAIVRRFLNEQKLPPKGAVRIEELINYFSYDYPQPQGDAPFSATMEVAACPWTPAHRLVRIGLKGREIAKDKRPASNLVFLIDVSGSMQPANKLPLLKQSLGLLIDQLGPEDQVAMAVYAGQSGTVLEPTRSKAKMRAALAKLESGGSTNGASGVQLAYELAEKGFIKGGTNRVILATDGDWNVGVTNPAELFEMIAKKAKGGVFLTVLGFGMDNLKDSMLVKLADKGNGNYGYIDTLIEAKKLLADELTSTLVTIAKDVKIQVEFNPAQVAAYRLIGYEKRMLAKEDFNDDTKDAGEIGAGHTVTALYEIVPAGGEVPTSFAKVDELKYQRPVEKPAEPDRKRVSDESGKELLTLKLRYKAPDGDASKLLEFPLTDTGATWEKSSRDFRFAAAVAGYGMLLRDSPHKGAATWDSVRELAVEGKGEDATGYRAEFITLLEKAKALAR